MLKSNNKLTSAIKSIAMLLALVMVLAMGLTACTDDEARAMAEEAKAKAEAAITQTQLNDAVSAALADYAKKADVITADGVSSAITDALKDYLKTADAVTEAAVNTAITNALKDYAKTSTVITQAKVEELIKASADKAAAAIEEANKKIEEQGEASNKLANSKIDEETWVNLTGTVDSINDVNTVVGACVEVDAIEREIEARQDEYTDADYITALNLCYAAKIQLYRATNLDQLKDILEDVVEAIEALPTIGSEAMRIKDLIDALNVPITTYDEAAVAEAKAEYEQWKVDYSADDTKAELKGINVAKLNYSVAKSAALKATYEALNAKIEAYIESKGVTLTDDVAADTAAANAAANKITIADGAALVDIYNDYVAFAGDPDELNGDFTLDDGDNNGTDGQKITFWSVIETYLEAYNKQRFELAKTHTIALINEEMAFIVHNLEVTADEAVNEELRNAVRNLAAAYSAYVKDSILYTGATYGEYKVGNFEETYARALAHLNAVEAIWVTDTEAGNLMDLVQAYYTTKDADGNDVQVDFADATTAEFLAEAKAELATNLESYIANIAEEVVAAYTATAPSTDVEAAPEA